MAKAKWTTPAQFIWLENQIPEFVKAQQDKVVRLFMKEMYDKWEQKWPTPPPTKEEVKHAKGSTEKALAIKRKHAEDRVKYWFHNHTRASLSGSGMRGILKSSPALKLVQPWQAYLNKFQSTKLKEKIEDTWKCYLNGVPEGVKPEKTKFEIQNKVAQTLYEEESDKVKGEVEEHHEKMRYNGSTPCVIGQNKAFQRSIDKLPRTLQLAAESIASQTGWNVSIMAGGLNPRLGGKITTLALHEGKTAGGKLFDKFFDDNSFETEVMGRFDEFLNESFALNAELEDSTPEINNSSLAESKSEGERNVKKKKVKKHKKKAELRSTGEREQEKTDKFEKVRKVLAKMGVSDLNNGGSESERGTSLRYIVCLFFCLYLCTSTPNPAASTSTPNPAASTSTPNPSASTSTPNPSASTSTPNSSASTSTPNPTQSGALDVGGTISEPSAPLISNT
ncbi:hypothetical protein F5888DRAFT_1800821 [Russula emetica]|nr:hypothetical protein F5888DRAFT_1800821 [Russula emetica]